MKDIFLDIGKIVTTVGLLGEVKVYPYADQPEDLCKFSEMFLGEQKKPVSIEKSRVQKNVVVIKFSGVDTQEVASLLRDKILYIRREDIVLDDNTNFVVDLIGIKVEDADTGEVYGNITQVFATGANDVYEIKSDDNVYYFPAVAEFIVDINIEDKVCTVRPIPGIFTESEDIR